jgi:hypothetical protein
VRGKLRRLDSSTAESNVNVFLRKTTTTSTTE